MPVFIQIADNPNCESMDAQVFQCRAAMATVTHILEEHGGVMEWCPVTGLDDGGAPCPATACLVDDSGAGACYLVVGGEWGLRLKSPDSTGAWDIADRTQWGAQYFLLPGDGSALKFAA